MRVNTSATARGGEEEGAIGGGANGGQRKMFWRDGFHGETDLNVHHKSAGTEMDVVVIYK